MTYGLAAAFLLAQYCFLWGLVRPGLMLLLAAAGLVACGELVGVLISDWSGCCG
jgi:hypothetical protein